MVDYHASNGAMGALPSHEVMDPEKLKAEVDRLNKVLEQREAVLLRHEGENFLLSAKVQQLEQQNRDTSRDLWTLQSTIAQALQYLDSSGGRQPLKAEVDKARHLLAASRRGSRGQIEAVPSGRALHPELGASSTQLRSPVNAAALQRDAVAVPKRENRPLRRTGSKVEGPSASERSPFGAPGTPVMTESRAVDAQRVERARPVPLRARSAGRGEQEEAQSTPIGSFRQMSPRGAARAPRVSSGSEAHPPSATSELQRLRTQFTRQRELLIRLLRKSALSEEKLSTLADDVTRREVIIHNLRQDQQNQQQEVVSLHQQFEIQTQQLQQQTHLQELAQAQTLQEMQLVLQQQQQLLEEHGILPPVVRSPGRGHHRSDSLPFVSTLVERASVPATIAGS